MQSVEIVLKSLNKNSGCINNLYKNLYNPEFYKIAYQNLYSKPSQMTPASDGSTIDGMSESRINKLIQKLKDKSYQPTNLRAITIPKKSGGTRNIKIPTFDDKLVQEVIRMLLEAIYNNKFSEHSHGFRPDKSCHTALKFVKQKFQGTKWWIKLDIDKCFDNINHQKLISVLAERIKEQKFLVLINKFLKCGYLNSWQYHKTYSGVPQGSIIGPILCNIYLHKLDLKIESMIKDFNKGEQRKVNKEYARLQKNQAQSRYDNKKNGRPASKCRIRYLKYKKLKNQYVRKYGKYDPMDPDFKRLSYVRYADDILIGLISSKEECIQKFNEIKNFLEKELLLSCNQKSEVIHNSKLVRFLGYDLSVMKSDSRKFINGGIALWLPYEVCKNFILDNGFGKFVCDAQTGKPKLKGTHKPILTNYDEMEILFHYNTKIRGLYNYYKMARNVCKLNGFNYICQISFLRTLAAKYKTSCAKLYKNKNYNHRKNGAHIGITYKNKFYEFFNGPFNVVKEIKIEKIDPDKIPNSYKYLSRNSLIKRMEAHKCEMCGDENGPFEIHHIRKLKDLKGKSNWDKLMISRRRKTLVLCHKCHNKLHPHI